MGRLDDIRLPPKWIELNLTKRECVVFISSEQDDLICQCGRTKSEHVNAVQHHHRVESWSPQYHTQSSPTDSYGTIVFEGGHYPNKARYVRLSYDSDPDLAVELITLVWGVPLPKLLITVRGGNSNFELKPWLGQLLQTGLIKAAKATNAWILTNGLNKGVAKHIGNAVQKERSMGVKRGRVVTIGIAPWGIVENRNSLIGHNKERTYSLLEHTSTKTVLLNPRHSHFLLVDNGSLGKFGGESFFRKRLEKYISLMPTSPNRGCDTPIVCVVIEGGFYTLRNISENLYDEPPIPVVIFAGTGRTADLVSFVVTEIDKGRKLEQLKTLIYEKMKYIYKIDDDVQCEVFYKEIERICGRRNLITVYSPRSADDEGFDVILLASIFRSQHWTPLQQLSLTLVWDRVDIATNEVFTYGRDWDRGSLEHAMMEALVSDRLQFINLLIEHGLNMQTFLTPKRLESLYSIERNHSKVMRSLLFEVLKLHGARAARARKRSNSTKSMSIYEPVTLHDIGVALNKMMGHVYKSTYIGVKTGRRSGKPRNEQQPHHSAAADYDFDDESDDELVNGSHFSQPFDDLFVWAVLTKRHRMALLLWPHGTGALAKALVAVKLNKYLGSKLEETETNLATEFSNNATEWETLSYELLDSSFKSNTKMARQLLTMELEYWSHQTCLTLAVIANHRMFLGHACCQSLLADLWMGALNIKSHVGIKVILGILFPFFVFLLDYKSMQELKLLPHQEKHNASPADMSSEEYQNRQNGGNESMLMLSKSKASFTSSVFKVDETAINGEDEHKIRRNSKVSGSKHRTKTLSTGVQTQEPVHHRHHRQSLENLGRKVHSHDNQHGHEPHHVQFDLSELSASNEINSKTDPSLQSSNLSSRSSSLSTIASTEKPEQKTKDKSAATHPEIKSKSINHHQHHQHNQNQLEYLSSSAVEVPERKYSLIEQLFKHATSHTKNELESRNSHYNNELEPDLHNNENVKHDHRQHEKYEFMTYTTRYASRDEDIPISFETTKKELNCWQTFYEFQLAPITNFFRHAIAYIIFVCCLSYTILIPQDRYHFGIVETYAIIYLITAGFEIIRDFISIDAYNWSQKINELKTKIWTICDLIFIAIFMIGVTLRCHAHVDILFFRYGLLIYRSSSIYWNLRLYKYMGAHRFLGPKLVMMSRMLKHMGYFAIIIFVVILSFGLAREAIRFPDVYPNWSNIAKAFLEPYVMMFGEVDSDTLLQCGEQHQAPCPVGHWVIPLIWIIYMMVANILIVNVLIAVFNGIYSEVDSIALEVWLFQRFTFVMEFERKPVLPPPFVIICHLFYVMRWIYEKCFDCFCEEHLEDKGFDTEPRQVILGNDHSLKIFLSPNEINQAFDFECDNVDSLYSYVKEENESTNILRKAGITGMGGPASIYMISGGGDGNGRNEHQFLQDGKHETAKGFAQLRTQIKEFSNEIEVQKVKLDRLIAILEQGNFELQRRQEVGLPPIIRS